MTLTVKPLKPSLPEYRQVKALYYRAFPEYEQEAWSRLLFKRLFRRADFLVFYDQDQFVGLSYIIHHHGIHYVLYLAVNDRIRSKGYGSQILAQLKQRYTPDTLILDIEHKMQMELSSISSAARGRLNRAEARAKRIRQIKYIWRLG